MTVAIIAAFTKKDRVLGKDGKIPWNIPGERSRFKALTTGNAVIMGRRTYEEIQHPLPDRLNIILSTAKTYSSENCRTARSLEEALHTAQNAGFDTVYIAGGQKVYEKAIPLAEILYLTEIDAEFDGDVFFPEFNENEYTKITGFHSDGTVPYTYFTYTKGLST